MLRRATALLAVFAAGLAVALGGCGSNDGNDGGRGGGAGTGTQQTTTENDGYGY